MGQKVYRYRKPEKALTTFLDRDETMEAMLATLEAYFRAIKWPEIADTINRNVQRLNGDGK
jgi:hypothetical protein